MLRLKYSSCVQAWIARAETATTAKNQRCALLRIVDIDVVQQREFEAGLYSQAWVVLEHCCDNLLHRDTLLLALLLEIWAG